MPRLRPLLALVALCSLLSSSTTRADDPAPLKPVLPGLELADGDSIVFLGDSITHQRLYTQYVEDYFYTRMPHLRLQLHNAGVGGARAWDALARFDEDVAAYNPKYVTILLGMNDGSYQPYNEEVFLTYERDMTALLARLEEINAIAIPMTPTMFDARADRMKANNRRDPRSIALYNSVLAYYGTWLRDEAEQRGLGFVDMWGPLNNITLEQRKKDPKFTLIQDAIHPGASGQVVMATAIINDLALPRQVSTITIQLPTGDAGKIVSRANGGELTDVLRSEQGVTFTFTAKSLPWVLPEEAALGVELTKLGHKLSREALEVHGLPAGQYKLVIDGVEVGQYSAATLERHVELQGNAKTPSISRHCRWPCSTSSVTKVRSMTCAVSGRTSSDSPVPGRLRRRSPQTRSCRSNSPR
ncbi:MAG: SGNH/GDSL hydrolase family protein [Planctomycetaceae bacterium]